jgi:uncharacterized protein YndB with AHSA1/START domain
MGYALQKENFTFTTSRVFNAPRDRVWKAWTDPQQFQQWFGPKGANIIQASIDLRPGGASKYGMEFGGQTMYGQWAFQEIKAPEKLVAVVSFLDKNGKIIPHPMMPNWPLEILSIVTFKAEGDKTRINVEWQAFNASDIERKTFEEGASGMDQGWGGTFERLEEYLGSH